MGTSQRGTWDVMTADERSSSTAQARADLLPKLGELQRQERAGKPTRVLSKDHVVRLLSNHGVRLLLAKKGVRLSRANPCAWDGDADAKAQEYLMQHPLEHKGALARTGTLTDDGKVFCHQCKKYVSLQVFEGKEVHSGVECCCNLGGAASGAQSDGSGDHQQLAAASGSALAAGSYTILMEENISLRRAVELANANQGHWHNLWYCVFCKTPNGEPLHYCSHCPAAFHWTCYQQQTGCAVPKEEVPEEGWFCSSFCEKQKEHSPRLAAPQDSAMVAPSPSRKTHPEAGLPGGQADTKQQAKAMKVTLPLKRALRDRTLEAAEPGSTHAAHVACGSSAAAAAAMPEAVGNEGSAVGGDGGGCGSRTAAVKPAVAKPGDLLKAAQKLREIRTSNEQLQGLTKSLQTKIEGLEAWKAQAEVASTKLQEQLAEEQAATKKARQQSQAETEAAVRNLHKEKEAVMQTLNAEKQAAVQQLHKERAEKAAAVRQMLIAQEEKAAIARQLQEFEVAGQEVVAAMQ